MNILIRDSEGLIHYGVAVRRGENWETEDGERLVPTGEKTEIMGWGKFDGPAEVYQVPGFTWQALIPADVA